MAYCKVEITIYHYVFSNLYQYEKHLTYYILYYSATSGQCKTLNNPPLCQ